MNPERRSLEGIDLRPATAADAAAVAGLILEIPGGLNDILADRRASEATVRAAFAARTTAFSHDRTILALVDGGPVGLMTRFPASAWAGLRRRTGLAMALGAGVRRVPALIWRGAVQEQTVGWMPRDVLWVMLLSVDPVWRGRGIGSAFLDIASEEAAAAGLRAVCLDVEAGSPAVAFYELCGFTVEGWGHSRARRGMRAFTALRLERSVPG